MLTEITVVTLLAVAVVLAMLIYGDCRVRALQDSARDVDGSKSSPTTGSNPPLDVRGGRIDGDSGKLERP